jgi:hypothetical protein
MRPAQLPPLKRPPAVAAPPTRHQVAGKLAQQRFGRRLAATQMNLKDRHPADEQHPKLGFAKLGIAAIAVALPPACLIHVPHILSLGKLGGLRNRLSHCLGDFLSQFVDRPQRHFNLIEVTKHLLRLPLALAVGASKQPHTRHQSRPVTARTDLGRQHRARRFATGRATQLM